MKKVYTTFKFVGSPGCEVAVCGSFNDWQAVPMREVSPGTFSKRLRLELCSHEYKFLVDGVWMADPTCTNWCLNDFGSINSVRSLSNGERPRQRSRGKDMRRRQAICNRG